LAGFVASTRDNDARIFFREGRDGRSCNAREGQDDGCIHGVLPGEQLMGQQWLMWLTPFNMYVRISLSRDDLQLKQKRTSDMDGRIICVQREI
jgi:hypothetical protein